MNPHPTPLNDPLIDLASRDTQLQAARLAQDAFAQSFRHTLELAAAERLQGIAETSRRLVEWASLAAGDGTALRQAMLLAGLDQWGIAYSRLFGAEAMLGLSELLSLLRAAFAKQAAAPSYPEFIRRINDDEQAAFGFKAELQRNIQLALWHAMIAETDEASAMDILRQVGGMLLGQLETLPELGWMVVANTLADIQIRCLTHGLASEGLAQETTQELFGALNQQLPAEQRQRIMDSATQAVIAWQQSSKTAH